MIEKSKNCLDFNRELLCRTVAGNRCDIVTITELFDGEEDDHRKMIVLLGRVHPGESPASIKMQGVMDFLSSDEKHA